MTRFDGADISHYQNEQGPIDWAALKAGSAGNWFACKATQRNNYKDPFLDSNRANAHTIGFRYILMYHWLSPNVAVKDQAGFYLSKIGTLQLNEGVMIDAEERGITEDNVFEFQDRVIQKTGRPLDIYTGAYVANGTIWSSARLYAKGNARHLAAYTSEQKANDLPGVSPPPWDAWQYSSNGPVPGIVGRCDMNRIDNFPIFDNICGIKAIPQPVGKKGPAMYFTNSEVRNFMGKDWGPNNIMWLMVFDGEKVTKFYVGPDEFIPGCPTGPKTNAELDRLPDFDGMKVPTATVPPYPTNFTGTLS